MHLHSRGTHSPITRLVAGLAASALAAGLSLGLAPAAHAAGAYFCPDNTQPYAPVSEVEAFAAGTAVTGLSVTRGTTPSPFTGSYIGYIAGGLGAGKDLLLFRLHSDVIDGTGVDGLKATGIWSGMSGSPVYAADGRLIGAVAYSLNADNVPVAGVTPAEYMKSIGTTAVGTATTVRTTGANLKVSAAGTRVAGTSLAGTALSPVRTVNVAGAAGTRANAFTNRTLARAPKSAKGAAFLRSRSFQPAAAQAALGEPLVAGGSIAALYTSGDLLVGAIGTVTAVCGDVVYAFGHPMDFIGETSLAMANASTALIVPDTSGAGTSYKQVSRIGNPIGMITEDRLMGIRGTVGTVTTYPIDVKVQNPSGAQVAAYHTDVALSDSGAVALAELTGQAAYEQLDAYWGGTGKVSWTIDFVRADGTSGSLRNSQVVADPSAFPDVVGTPPADDLWAISDNGFEKVTITRVGVTLRLLSQDSLEYQLSGVQLRRAPGKWSALDGRTLRAGHTYSVRPRFTLRRNGLATRTTVTGGPVTFTLSKKARSHGSFDLAAPNDPSAACDGDTCDDISGGGGSYAGFDDLLAGLADEGSSALVTGQLGYRRTKGSTSRSYTWTGPGVMTGSSEDVFRIRK